MGSVDKDREDALFFYNADTLSQSNKSSLIGLDTIKIITNFINITYHFY